MISRYQGILRSVKSRLGVIMGYRAGKSVLVKYLTVDLKSLGEDVQKSVGKDHRKSLGRDDV